MPRIDLNLHVPFQVENLGELHGRVLDGQARVKRLIGRHAITLLVLMALAGTLPATGAKVAVCMAVLDTLIIACGLVQFVAGGLLLHALEQAHLLWPKMDDEDVNLALHAVAAKTS